MTNEITLFDNPATRCPVILLVDRSASMNEVIADCGVETGCTFFEDGQEWVELSGGTTRMDKLLLGLGSFFKAVSDDEVAKYSVEVKTISFGDNVKHESDFVSFMNIDSYSPSTIIPEGETSLGAGLEEALNVLKNRKRFYKKNGISYYQPWIVLMTDGKPTDSCQLVAKKARKMAENKKLNFFGVGIGKGYDSECLRKILPPNRPPLELDQNRFEEFFLWLSASLAQTSKSNQRDSINLPPVDGWAVLTP